VSEQGPSLRHACMASLSGSMPSQQLFVDFNDLSDYLEGGMASALLFLLRCAIRECKGYILSTNSYCMAGRQFHQSGGRPMEFQHLHLMRLVQWCFSNQGQFFLLHLWKLIEYLREAPPFAPVSIALYVNIKSSPLNGLPICGWNTLDIWDNPACEQLEAFKVGHVW
jgi:hypothetical protein